MKQLSGVQRKKNMNSCAMVIVKCSDTCIMTDPTFTVPLERSVRRIQFDVVFFDFQHVLTLRHASSECQNKVHVHCWILIFFLRQSG